MADNGAPTMTQVVDVPPADELQVPASPAGIARSGGDDGGGAPAVAEPPADTAGEATGAVTATWHKGKKITRLYNSGKANSWIALAGIGWKRLNPANESATGALTIIAAHAADNGLTVNALEGDDEYIHELYCW